jgi:hypothetical protein
MRAKFINEKFSEDSDPIHDMGIGVFAKHNFKTEQEILNWFWLVLPVIFGGKIPEDIIYNTVDPGFLKEKYWDKYLNYLHKYIYLNGKEYNPQWEFNNAIHNALIRKGYKLYPSFEKEFKNSHYKDKNYLKINESLNEKFTEYSDPVQDMNIGDIHRFQKEYDIIKTKSRKQMSMYFFNNDYILAASEVIRAMLKNALDNKKIIYNKNYWPNIFLRAKKIFHINEYGDKIVKEYFKKKFNIDIEI